MKFLKWHFKNWMVKGILLLTFGIVVGLYFFGTYQEFVWTLIGAMIINCFVLVGNIFYFKRNKL